jgi:hypothetical protein
MENLGRLLMLAGAFLLVLGGGLYLVTRIGLPLGRLPGDIRLEWKGGVFYFPLTTCIVLSLLLSSVLALLARFWKK